MQPPCVGKKNVITTTLHECSNWKETLYPQNNPATARSTQKTRKVENGQKITDPCTKSDRKFDDSLLSRPPLLAALTLEEDRTTGPSGDFQVGGILRRTADCRCCARRSDTVTEQI
jgi:hypothetical protein